MGSELYGQIAIGDCPKLINLRALSSLETVRVRCSLFRNEKLPTSKAEWLQRLVEGIGGQFTSSDTDERGVCHNRGLKELPLIGKAADEGLDDLRDQAMLHLSETTVLA